MISFNNLGNLGRLANQMFQYASLKGIAKNPGYDLYAKNDGHDQYFTGCFAIKKSYLIQWVNETDWDYLNYAMINFEKSLWDFSKEKNLKCFEMDNLHMDCNIFGKGNMQRITI